MTPSLTTPYLRPTMNTSPGINLYMQSNFGIRVHPGGRCGPAGVRSCRATLVLSAGLCCALAYAKPGAGDTLNRADSMVPADEKSMTGDGLVPRNTPPATPEPRPAAPPAATPPPAKDSSNIQWLDDAVMHKARQAALEKYRAVLKRHPQDPIVMNRLACCLLETGNTDEARKIAEDAIRLAPDRLGPKLLLGAILDARTNSVKMIPYYQDLTTRFPKLGDAWGSLGAHQFNAGRKAEGLAAIRKWTELEPDSMSAWDAYAQVLTATGDYDGAGRATERSSELESLFFRLRYSAPKRD